MLELVCHKQNERLKNKKHLTADLQKNKKKEEINRMSTYRIRGISVVVGHDAAVADKAVDKAGDN